MKLQPAADDDVMDATEVPAEKKLAMNCRCPLCHDCKKSKTECSCDNPHWKQAAKNAYSLTFPNLQVQDYSIRPFFAHGWYKDMHTAAIRDGGDVDYDDPQQKFVTVDFRTEGAARRFANLLTKEFYVDRQKITSEAPVQRLAGKKVASVQKLANTESWETVPLFSSSEGQIPDGNNPSRVSALSEFKESGSMAGVQFASDESDWDDAHANEMEGGQDVDSALPVPSIDWSGFPGSQSREAKKASVRKRASINLDKFVRLASGQYIFAAEDENQDGVLEATDENAEDAPGEGDEVLVVSLDDAMVGTMSEEADGVVTIMTDAAEVADGEAEAFDAPVEAVRKVVKRAVQLRTLPEHLQVKGLDVQYGKVAGKLHRVVTSTVVDVVLGDSPPRRVKTADVIAFVRTARFPKAAKLPKKTASKEPFSAINGIFDD